MTDAEVVQNPLADVGLQYDGDDFHRAAASIATEDVDGKDPAEQLGPG